MALDAIAGWFIPWPGMRYRKGPELRAPCGRRKFGRSPLTRENIAGFPRLGAAEAVSLTRRFDAGVTNPHKTPILQACDLRKRGEHTSEPQVQAHPN